MLPGSGPSKQGEDDATNWLNNSTKNDDTLLLATCFILFALDRGIYFHIKNYTSGLPVFEWVPVPGVPVLFFFIYFFLDEKTTFRYKEKTVTECCPIYKMLKGSMSRDFRPLFIMSRAHLGP